MNKYIVLGPPGSGKSTQATLLAKAFGFVRISVGDIFRWNIKNHTKLAARIHRYIESGTLVPDEIVEEVARERLRQHDWNFGFVLDGYPATPAQTEWFLESYDVDGVILLEVSEKILKERLANLRVCPACGFDHNLIHERFRSDSHCDLCGAELALRSSDSPTAIEDRLAEFNSKTLPAIDLFRRKELVVVVDGSAPTEAIHDYILAELGLTSEAMIQSVKKRQTAVRTDSQERQDRS